MKTSAFFLFSTLLFTASLASADVYTWTGGSNGMGYTWEAGLWDLSGLPGPADTAKFADYPLGLSRKAAGTWQSVSLLSEQEVDTIWFSDCGAISANAYNYPLKFSHIIADDWAEPATNKLAGSKNILVTTNATVYVGANRVLFMGNLSAESPDTSLDFTGAGTLILNGGTGNNLNGRVYIGQGTLLINPDWNNTSIRGPLVVGDGEHRAVFATGGNYANQIAQLSEVTVNSNSVMRFHAAPNGTTPYSQTVHLNYAEVDLSTLYLIFQNKTDYPLLELTGSTITNGSIRIFGSNATNEFLVVRAASVPTTIYSEFNFSSWPVYVNIEDGAAPVDCEMAGPITGGIRINKQGAGTWLWSHPDGAPNYYRAGHAIEVLEGAFIVNNVQNSGVGSNNVNVASGALFGGTGITFGEMNPTYPGYGIPGSIALTGGANGPATFAPGTPDPETGVWIPGTFRVGFESFTNNVTFGASSVLRCQLSKNGGASRLAVTGNLLLDSKDNTDALAVVCDEPRLPAGVYTVASFTECLKGRFDSVTVNGVPLADTSCKLAYLDADKNPIAAMDYIGAGSIVLTVPPEETVIIVR